MDQRLATAVVVCALALTASNAAAGCVQAANERVAQPMDQDAEQQAEGPLARVIVKVRESAGATERTASPQEAIERNKARLAELMRGHGAVTIEPIAGQPLVVMEVTPQGMQNLLGSSLVEGVQEDRPEMPQ